MPAAAARRVGSMNEDDRIAESQTIEMGGRVGRTACHSSPVHDAGAVDSVSLRRGSGLPRQQGRGNSAIAQRPGQPVRVLHPRIQSRGWRFLPARVV